MVALLLVAEHSAVHNFMVDIRIMASPKRETNVKYILNKLKMSDDIVVWDDRPNGGDAMYTARKAWLSPIDKDTTHRLVLQDDIDICENFIENVEEIAKRNPDNIVSLINFLNPTNYPNKRGTPYYQVSVVPGCAIMMPSYMITNCMDWCDNYEDKSLAIHDDLMISKFANTNGVKLVTILPCIVQHCGAESLLSIKYSWDRICKNYDPNPNVDWSIHSIQKVR